MDIVSFLKQHIGVTPQVQLAISAAFVTKKFSKGHRLLEPNDRSQKVFFFEKGFARTFYFKDTKDITHHFFFEDSFAVPIDSIFYDQPCPYGIELIEESTVAVANYSQIESYISQSPELEKFIRLMLIGLLRTFSEQLYSIQFQSAAERYASLSKKYPDILLRAPLGHIASYLGITQQTLSVIRSQRTIAF